MGVCGFGGALFLLRMEEAMEGPGMLGGRREKVSRWGWDVAAAPMEFAVLHDKIRRDPVTEKVTGASGMIYTYCEIFVHLEVKVGRVHSVVVSDGAHLLTPFYLHALVHDDPVQVTVERVCKMQLPALDPGMSDDDDVSPVGMDVSCQNDKPIPHGMHGMPECQPFSSCYDPVFSKMTMGPESPGLAKSGPLGRGHRQVESIGSNG